MTRTARDVVADRTGRRARRFPDLPLGPLDVTGLSGRDAALALAIDHCVSKRWLTLQTIVASRLDRGWDRVEPRLQGVLLAGAAQILFFDRVPDHAAIDEMVETTKRLVRPKAAGLVNAVLRRVADLKADIVPRLDPDRRDEVPLADGRGLRLKASIFPENIPSWLATTTSHGPALIEHWLHTRGAAATLRIAHHDLYDAPLILNGVEEGGTDLRPHDETGCAVFDGDHASLTSLLQTHPTWRVQDPTSARPVATTAALRPTVILDYCAGKGTKTRQLRDVHPSATIVATDRDESRRRHLHTLADDIDVIVRPPGELERWHGRVDLLVLDVPCTNTGVLARRPEAKYRFSRASLGALVDEQRQIVADTLPFLRPGGHLLFATCSLEQAENDEQASWISRWHRFDVLDRSLALPEGQPGDPPSRYRDGGGHALLRSPG